MASIKFTLEDGTSFTTALENPLVTIGRHNESMVQLASPSVSSHHGALRLRADGYYVQDIGSRNGTRVNGAEIEEAKLNDGDRLHFGDVRAIFSESDDVPVAIAIAEPVAAPKFLPTPAILAKPESLQSTQPAPSPSVSKRRITPVRRYAEAEETGGGCAMAMLLTILFICAFLIGLFVRHYNETGGFLPGDLLDRMPKIKLEKPSE